MPWNMYFNSIISAAGVEAWTRKIHPDPRPGEYLPREEQQRVIDEFVRQSEESATGKR